MFTTSRDVDSTGIVFGCDLALPYSAPGDCACPAPQPEGFAGPCETMFPSAFAAPDAISCSRAPAP